MIREQRGVYVAPHTIDGCPFLYAIKRNGDRLPRIVVLRPDVDRGAAVEYLTAQLDRHDPGPRLVVEAAAAPALPPPPESATAYAMRIAQQVQKTRPIRRIS